MSGPEDKTSAGTIRRERLFCFLVRTDCRNCLITHHRHFVCNLQPRRGMDELRSDVTQSEWEPVRMKWDWTDCSTSRDCSLHRWLLLLEQVRTSSIFTLSMLLLFFFFLLTRTCNLQSSFFFYFFFKWASRSSISASKFSPPGLHWPPNGSAVLHRSGWMAELSKAVIITPLTDPIHLYININIYISMYAQDTDHASWATQGTMRL